MASWLHSHLFCKQIFPCGKSQHQSRAIQCGLPLVSALCVASSWVAGNCLCQERAQATALGNVVIKRDSQCPPQCFVLILFSSPLQTIMRGWIPWITTNQIVFFFCPLSVSAPQFLGCSFPGCQVRSRAAMQKYAIQLAAFLTLGQEWSQQGWESKVGAEWTGLHYCCISGSNKDVFSHHCLWAKSARTTLALCPWYNLPSNKIIHPWKMKSGSISCFFCKTATLQQQQWSMTLVLAPLLLLWRLVDNIPHANSYSPQWADTGTRRWTSGGLSAWTSHPNHLMCLASQVLDSTPVQLVWCSFVACSAGVFATQSWLGLPEVQSSILSLALVWDQDSLVIHWPETVKQYRQISVYRFPWISENKLHEWKVAKDKWRSVPKDFWVYLSASPGKELSWGLQPFTSAGKWHRTPVFRYLSPSYLYASKLVVLWSWPFCPSLSE